MRALLLAGVLAFTASAARAAPPAWVVERPSSSIRFSSSFSGTAFSGSFSRWSADIAFDPANLAASSVSASIDTASAVTGDKDRDAALPADAFFDAAKFPRATFVAHAFKALGGGRYEADGELTMRGVTRPLTLPFTLKIVGGQATMNAQISLDRLAFGVGQDEWRATDVVPADVKVAISLTARRK